MVVSHERSGTHFLMNSIAANSTYISSPWINLDFELGVNFHHSPTISNILNTIAQKPVLNIIKSHHAADFFEQSLQSLDHKIHIFYIVRDVRDVMVSFHRFLNRLPWDEGPKTKTVAEFIRSSPRAALLRYQKEQYDTMVHRWQAHVEGWIRLRSKHPELGICVIRYEDLSQDFENTVKEILRILKQKPNHPITRPPKGENVVVPGPGRVGSYEAVLPEEEQSYILSVAGRTLEKLGYRTKAETSDMAKAAGAAPMHRAVHSGEDSE